jgi:hypothetical protein
MPMSATRLHSLTAVFLAALYGVVGFTGESLHYLVTSPTTFWSNSRSSETVYYHVHAPDYHGHFHRHAHHGGHSHAAIDVTHDSRQARQGVAITSSDWDHEPHACPILTIVASIKLGHAACCPAPIILDSAGTPSCERALFPAFEIASSLFARGPPSGTFA